MELERVRKPYCLWCYQPLQRFQREAARACERCGKSNLRQDLRRYWTRERELVQWERIAKFWVVVACLAIAGLLFATPGGIGTGQGWAIGFPLLLGPLGWETASKLTQDKPYLRADLTWALVFLAPVAFLALFGLLAEGLATFGFALVLGIPAYLAAWAVLAAGRAFRRFRHLRVLREQTR